MSNQKKITSRLRKAVGSDRLVRLDRKSHPSEFVEGFVVAVGRRWALLQRTMNGGFFDGHTAIRLDEVSSIQVDSSFESTFARTRPEWPPAPPNPGEHLDLDTTSGMLTWLIRAGDLFAIERNKKFNAMWIGVPNELTRRWLYVWEVRADASWREQPLGYRLRSIVVVTVNDHYQRGLAAVAGPAPEGASPAEWSAGNIERKG